MDSKSTGSGDTILDGWKEASIRLDSPTLSEVIVTTLCRTLSVKVTTESDTDHVFWLELCTWMFTGSPGGPLMASVTSSVPKKPTRGEVLP